MADFDVEYVGNSPNDIQGRLSGLGVQAQTRANRALVQAAEDIKRDLEKTAPVDTGEYKSSWYIMQVADDEVWVLNEADHAKYVMLPNQRMVNSSKADLPASGVLHDVKGIAKDHKDTVNLNLSEQLERLFNKFKIK